MHSVCLAMHYSKMGMKFASSTPQKGLLAMCTDAASIMAGVLHVVTLFMLHCYKLSEISRQD